MPRERVYTDDAAKQRAYRGRKKMQDAANNLQLLNTEAKENAQARQAIEAHLAIAFNHLAQEQNFYAPIRRQDLGTMLDHATAIHRRASAIERERDRAEQEHRNGEQEARNADTRPYRPY